MKRIRMVPEAREELEIAISYYASYQLDFGLSFREEFEATLGRLRQFPEAARRIRDDIRRRSILKFPYYVLYRVTNDEILILAVCHRRRNPAYREIKELPGMYRYADPGDASICWPKQCVKKGTC